MNYRQYQLALFEFAREVLDIMADTEDWDVETLDAIKEKAHELGLVVGAFERVYPDPSSFPFGARELTPR